MAIPFDAVDPGIDEESDEDESPGELALRLAREKACSGARLAPGRVAVGADTVVAVDLQALGKPNSSDEARRMLRLLRSREHQVITAVAAARIDAAPPGPQVSAGRVATARVWMRSYGDPEIDAYVARGEPFDKAGGYAIQDQIFRPCERVEGCYLTVVGLPIPQLCAVLAEVGATLSPDVSRLQAACDLCASATLDPSISGLAHLSCVRRAPPR